MKESVYLGIDVSKGYADFVLVDINQELIEPLFQLDDTPKGHDKLGIILDQYASTKPDVEICCGVESTGGYERNWYNYLLSLSGEIPVKVALLNPVVVKGISKASLNRTITDGISALNIACYLISYKGKVNYCQGDAEQKNPFKSGRSLYTYQRMLNKQKVQLNNQLEKLLYQYFSEVLVYCRNGIPMWLLRTLSKYPTAQSIKKAGVGKLRKIKEIGPNRAIRIVEKAKQNRQDSSSHIGFIIKNTCLEILHKKEKISESKAFLEATYKDNDLVKLLCSIIGIGYSSAIAILFEVEDINRFPTTKKIAAYFGVNPEFKQSGDGTWGSHLSKKGRKSMRAVLYMACFSAIKYDPLMKKKYADIRAEGKCHYFAMGVLMHKMIRIIYGVLKSGDPYDAAIDQRNRQKSLEKQSDLQELKKQQTRDNLKKKRRYQKQKLDEIPISNRKVKKIKELETS